MPTLYHFYLRAKDLICRYEPHSLIMQGVWAMHDQYKQGAEGLRHYRPWEILLAIQWTLQEASFVSCVRIPANRNDFHKIINIIYEMEGTIRIDPNLVGPFHFMRRMAFQQFPLQEGANGAAMARQYLMFAFLPDRDPIAAAFRNSTGLTLRDTSIAAYMIYALAVLSDAPVLNPSDLHKLHTLQPGPFGALMGLLTKDVAALHEWFSSPKMVEVPIARQRIILSPLIDAPMLQLPTGEIVSYYPTLLMRSLETLIYRVLRHLETPELGSRFGVMFEDYLAHCLDCAGVRYVRETELKCRVGDQSKSVDFLAEEEDCVVLIEAKGVELSTIGQVANETEFLFRSLKPIFQALHQGFELRVRLDALQLEEPLVRKETFLIVVTHADFNLGSNEAFSQMFADRLIKKLGKEFGNPLPIPFKNVFLISAFELEMMLELIRTGKGTFGSILRFAQTQNIEVRTQKYQFRQHLRAISGDIKLLPILQGALGDLNSHIRLE